MQKSYSRVTLNLLQKCLEHICSNVSFEKHWNKFGIIDFFKNSLEQTNCYFKFSQNLFLKQVYVTSN